MANNEFKPRRDDLAPVDTDSQDGFLNRWSRRKATERSGRVNEDRIDKELKIDPSDPSDEQLARHPTDADMPPIESLNESSEFSEFMSPQVSDELRRLALRKLFHFPTFNTRDGLDDYDEDYRSFEVLKDTITADMHHRMEREVAENEEQKDTTGAADASTPDNVKTDSDQVAAVSQRTKAEQDDLESPASEGNVTSSSSS